MLFLRQPLGVLLIFIPFVLFMGTMGYAGKPPSHIRLRIESKKTEISINVADCSAHKAKKPLGAATVSLKNGRFLDLKADKNDSYVSFLGGRGSGSEDETDVVSISYGEYFSFVLKPNNVLELIKINIPKSNLDIIAPLSKISLTGKEDLNIGSLSLKAQTITNNANVSAGSLLFWAYGKDGTGGIIKNTPGGIFRIGLLSIEKGNLENQGKIETQDEIERLNAYLTIFMNKNKLLNVLNAVICSKTGLSIIDFSLLENKGKIEMFNEKECCFLSGEVATSSTVICAGRFIADIKCKNNLECIPPTNYDSGFESGSDSECLCTDSRVLGVSLCKIAGTNLADARRRTLVRSSSWVRQRSDSDSEDASSDSDSEDLFDLEKKTTPESPPGTSQPFYEINETINETLLLRLKAEAQEEEEPEIPVFKHRVFPPRRLRSGFLRVDDPETSLEFSHQMGEAFVGKEPSLHLPRRPAPQISHRQASPRMVGPPLAKIMRRFNVLQTPVKKAQHAIFSTAARIPPPSERQRVLSGKAEMLFGLEDKVRSLEGMVGLKEGGDSEQVDFNLPEIPEGQSAVFSQLSLAAKISVVLETTRITLSELFFSKGSVYKLYRILWETCLKFNHWVLFCVTLGFLFWGRRKFFPFLKTIFSKP
jgi:hypothetical protein